MRDPYKRLAEAARQVLEKSAKSGAITAPVFLVEGAALDELRAALEALENGPADPPIIRRGSLKGRRQHRWGDDRTCLACGLSIRNAGSVTLEYVFEGTVVWRGNGVTPICDANALRAYAQGLARPAARPDDPIGVDDYVVDKEDERETPRAYRVKAVARRDGIDYLTLEPDDYGQEVDAANFNRWPAPGSFWSADGD